MHIRHDVIHQNEVRRSGLTAADKNRNDAINDLGLSYMERSAAIDAIAGHHGMTSAQRDELAQRSDSYLTERERLIRGHCTREHDRQDRGGNMRPTAPRGGAAEVRSDAAAAEVAWHRSVANLNARYDQAEDRSVVRSDVRPSQAHAPSPRGDAAEAEHAWRRSVANLNARYDRS